LTVTPGFAASNWVAILLKAAVSDVAANTTRVPEGIADADADAGAADADAGADAGAADVPGAAAVVDDDELHAASATTSTPAPTPARTFVTRTFPRLVTMFLAKIPAAGGPGITLGG
jgi:hypothetical protein